VDGTIYSPYSMEPLKNLVLILRKLASLLQKLMLIRLSAYKFVSIRRAL